VVGANSLVRGEIPGKCLAVGFPARVVSKAPEFPRPVSADEKVGILADIMDEFVLHLRDSGYVCVQQDGILTVGEPAGRGWFRRARTWRLAVRYRETPAPGTGEDVLLSLPPVSAAERMALTRRGAMWIDLENKERSDKGNNLGEEVAQYLKRYGVRLLRIG
jgi:hypothetical protein